MDALVPTGVDRERGLGQRSHTADDYFGAANDGNDVHALSPGHRSSPR